MEWTVVLTGPAKKSLDRIQERDHKRILATLTAMQKDPFGEDIRRLHGLSGFRRRVGSWRIFFEVIPERQQVVISAVERRTSTTY